VLKENVAMLAMAREMGFSIAPDHEEGPSVVHVIKDLRDIAEQAS
jgi:hypothetical protein